MGFFAEAGPVSIFVSNHLIPDEFSFVAADEPSFVSADEAVRIVAGAEARLRIVGTRVDATEIVRLFRPEYKSIKHNGLTDLHYVREADLNLASQALRLQSVCTRVEATGFVVPDCQLEVCKTGRRESVLGIMSRFQCFYPGQSYIVKPIGCLPSPGPVRCRCDIQPAVRAVLACRSSAWGRLKRTTLASLACHHNLRDRTE